MPATAKFQQFSAVSVTPPTGTAVSLLSLIQAAFTQTNDPITAPTVVRELGISMDPFLVDGTTAAIGYIFMGDQYVTATRKGVRFSANATDRTRPIFPNVPVAEVFVVSTVANSVLNILLWQ